jgi:ribonuclease HI
MKKSILTIYSDGGARGNPVRQRVHLLLKKMGKQSSKKQIFGKGNQQCCRIPGSNGSFKMAFEKQEHRFLPIVLKLDSQLVVRQLTGVYKI